MERTASRPPPGGGANWAIFFAPLGVTALVIVGAMVVVWVSDPEPADRPEVERLDLREVEPLAESPRLSSVGDSRGEEEESPDSEPIVQASLENARRIDATQPGIEVGSNAAASPSGGPDEDFEDDEDDFVDMTSDVERTPEERRAARATLIEKTSAVPFMAPMMERLRQRREAKASGEDIDPTNPEAPQNGSNEEVGDAPLEQAQPGAAGAPSQ